MPYRFLEDVVIADVAFEAWGGSLEETMTSASDATANIMVGDLASIRPRQYRHLQIKENQIDMLLFQLLQELIYYKDAEKLLLRISQVKVQGKDQHYILDGMAAGEKLDPNRHHTRVDVKAVTLHRFRLEKSDEGWRTFVILDI